MLLDVLNEAAVPNGTRAQLHKLPLVKQGSCHAKICRATITDPGRGSNASTSLCLEQLSRPFIFVKQRSSTFEEHEIATVQRELHAAYTVQCRNLETERARACRTQPHHCSHSVHQNACTNQPVVEALLRFHRNT